MILKSPATVDDLREVPKDGRTYELVGGAIVVTPAGMRHANVAARITAVLANFVHGRDLGDVYTEGVGIQLPNGNVRSPDVAVVLREKLPDGVSPPGYGPLVPDVVVEVLSPSDSATELARKVREYIDCGVQVVWVVDPERRTVTIHRPHAVPGILGRDGELTVAGVLPGFSCRVSEFFPR